MAMEGLGSSTVRVWSWPSPSSMRTKRADGLGSQAATFGGLGEKRTLSTSRSPSEISIASTVGNCSA